jgi:hypothetical protein
MYQKHCSTVSKKDAAMSEKSKVVARLEMEMEMLEGMDRDGLLHVLEGEMRVYDGSVGEVVRGRKEGVDGRIGRWRGGKG